MQSIVNGGVYRVNFTGSSNAEFKGTHPAIVIRTLKEEQIYFVVPLTSFTREKMDRARRKGYGTHVKSTRSIARIDKIQLVHNGQIKNRWIENNSYLKITKEELKQLDEKLNNYVKLSSDKAEKEYSKYMHQYNEVFYDFKKLFENDVPNQNIFSSSLEGDTLQITCKKSAVHWLTQSDLQEISKHFYTSNEINIQISEGMIIIKIT